MPVDEVRSWFDKKEVTCSGRGPQVDLKGDSRLGSPYDFALNFFKFFQDRRCELGVVNGRF